MNYLEKKAYIFGSIFALSNKLQTLGDKFDRGLTVKQWLLLISIFKCESDSPTISEVAALIGNSRQNITPVLLSLTSIILAISLFAHPLQNLRAIISL